MRLLAEKLVGDVAAAIFVGGVDLPIRRQGGGHAMQKSLSVVAAEGLCESFFVLQLARNWDTRRQIKVCSFVRATALPQDSKYALTDQPRNK